MKTAAVLAFSGLLIGALLIVKPKPLEAAMLKDFLITAEKATAFFPGAQPSPILAEETGEVRTQGEISRESTKTPDEVSREALDSARETEEQAQEDAEEAA